MNAVREGVSALTNPSAPPVRVITVWIPDWPIVAYLRSTAREIGAADRPEDSDPIALFHGNTVVACNQAARNAGVSRAQRRRDAQAACPALRIARADESRDARSFHDVLAVLERLSPGVQPLRRVLPLCGLAGPHGFIGANAPQRKLCSARSRTPASPMHTRVSPTGSSQQSRPRAARAHGPTLLPLPSFLPAVQPIFSPRFP
ncbi:hypothetical protein ACFOEP_05915 [Microbacterium amylolyticum]|uniref:Y-family DNA polymerase n=1 Tax=Microbacterium amylolyticum TaxID=936337 RepID=UPI003615028B